LDGPANGSGGRRARPGQTGSTTVGPASPSGLGAVLLILGAFGLLLASRIEARSEVQGEEGLIDDANHANAIDQVVACANGNFEKLIDLSLGRSRSVLLQQEWQDHVSASTPRMVGLGACAGLGAGETDGRMERGTGRARRLQITTGRSVPPGKPERKTSLKASPTSARPGILAGFTAAELAPGFRPNVLRELIREAKRLGFDSREMYETRWPNAAKLGRSPSRA
jgi:hypothetical protein